MYGAILGDIIGSPYEFDRGNKTKEFPLFSFNSEFTDDTVMTIAVADAFLETLDGRKCRIDSLDEEQLKNKLVEKLREYGKRYPNAGYGIKFSLWLSSETPQPYNSFGNGSAMRVSSVAWLFDDIVSVVEAARISAEVTHNHPEGIKGAQAVAAAIFLARTGASKDTIRKYIHDEFGYDLSRTCDAIRPGYYHVESCQETVPEALTAFLEGNSFEDVIRIAVSLGGDCDTLTAIAGSIAEAFYGVSGNMKTKCYFGLPVDMRMILAEFDAFRKGIRFISAQTIKEIHDSGFILESGEEILLQNCTPGADYIASRGVLLLEGCNPALDLYYPSQQKPLRIICCGQEQLYRKLLALFRTNGYRTFDMT